MSLNPTSPATASATRGASAAHRVFRPDAPSAKLSFNISAFNGNTTNFNKCAPPPSSKLSAVPVQPRELPSFSTGNKRIGGAGMMMPM
jgi:hypothetical protein